MIADVTGGSLMVVGAILMLGSALGTLRFPGPVARLHAATKAASLGLALIALGAGITLGASAVALTALVVVFQLLTAPIAGHLLARAALSARPADHHVAAPPSPDPARVAAPPGRIPAWLAVAALTLLWVGLWADVSAANIAGGIIAGLAVTVLFRPREAGPRLRLRPLGALRFVLAFVAALIRGTYAVAREAFDPDDCSIRPAVVTVSLQEASRASLVLTATAVTLTPGSVAVHIDLERPGLMVHVLHFNGPEAVRRDVARLHAVAASAFATPREVPA
jgi:monovalent cation/proton antiporter MnhG/PhaG subunit